MKRRLFTPSPTLPMSMTVYDKYFLSRYRKQPSFNISRFGNQDAVLHVSTPCCPSRNRLDPHSERCDDGNSNALAPANHRHLNFSTSGVCAGPHHSESTFIDERQKHVTHFLTCSSLDGCMVTRVPTLSCLIMFIFGKRAVLLFEIQSMPLLQSPPLVPHACEMVG